MFGIRILGLQPRVLDRTPHREVVQALPGVVPDAQGAVDLVVEEATDSGTDDLLATVQQTNEAAEDPFSVGEEEEGEDDR